MTCPRRTRSWSARSPRRQRHGAHWRPQPEHHGIGAAEESGRGEILAQGGTGAGKPVEPCARTGAAVAGHVQGAGNGRTLLGEVEGVEDEIDTTTEALRSHHMDRLKNHKCSAKNGMIYLDMLTNLERIGDHAENIATSAKSARGFDTIFLLIYGLTKWFSRGIFAAFELWRCFRWRGNL